jgi:hypothetical protein
MADFYKYDGHCGYCGSSQKVDAGECVSIHGYTMPWGIHGGRSADCRGSQHPALEVSKEGLKLRIEHTKGFIKDVCLSLQESGEAGFEVPCLSQAGKPMTIKPFDRNHKKGLERYRQNLNNQLKSANEDLGQTTKALELWKPTKLVFAIPQKVQKIHMTGSYTYQLKYKLAHCEGNCSTTYKSHVAEKDFAELSEAQQCKVCKKELDRRNKVRTLGQQKEAFRKVTDFTTIDEAELMQAIADFKKLGFWQDKEHLQRVHINYELAVHGKKIKSTRYPVK